MAPSVLGKRTANVLEEEDLNAVPTPRSTKRLRNLHIHEEVDEDDGIPAKAKVRVTPRRLTRGTRSKVNSLKSGVQGVVDIDGVNNENREPEPEPENNNEDITRVEEPSRIASNPRTEFATPHKSRFRDALASDTAKTPTTPRHRVIVGAKPLTPRTPRTPRALSLAGPAITNTVYTPAKQLFARNASPGQLVGRENEHDELKTVISNALGEYKGSCVYVSGPPGTGKSAVVGGLLGEFDIAKFLKDKHDKKEFENVKTASINCASITNARDIYGRLLDELSPETVEKQIFKKSEMDMLRSMFISRAKKNATFYVVTLDEIDHLLSTTTSDDSSVLSTLSIPPSPQSQES
ncbi:ATPase, AAA-type, core [Ascosphaera apis ARSEF 7405]|uniref:ATPase, AAA-type, core n=1 Tax=Ascosphaera apis ARSEF 7405 TaxID=392613 RepID=A0A168ALK0_9EURO|nr:ATPase, AAA-type, core [Ascosphaera apis ARSEF 7405]